MIPKIRNYEFSFSLAILIGKRELDALLCLSPWCLVIVMWVLLVVPWVSLQCVIVVFPNHTDLLFSVMYHSHACIIEFIEVVAERPRI